MILIVITIIIEVVTKHFLNSDVILVEGDQILIF